MTRNFMEKYDVRENLNLYSQLKLVHLREKNDVSHDHENERRKWLREKQQERDRV